MGQRSPPDAASLHEAGAAVRVASPRPAVIDRRRLHALGLEARLAPALAEGVFDILAGDEVAFVHDWVQRNGCCAPRLDLAPQGRGPQSTISAPATATAEPKRSKRSGGWRSTAQSQSTEAAM